MRILCYFEKENELYKTKYFMNISKYRHMGKVIPKYVNFCMGILTRDGDLPPPGGSAVIRSAGGRRRIPGALQSVLFVVTFGAYSYTDTMSNFITTQEQSRV